MNKRTISTFGLLIDKSKPGYGNSNEENTARCFFENADVLNNITKVNIVNIKRFRIILKTIANGHNINLVLFKKYALKTAHLFTEKYPRYSMSPTVSGGLYICAQVHVHFVPTQR